MPSSADPLVLTQVSSGWNAVFNPIVYTVKTLRYPENGYSDVYSIGSSDLVNEGGFLRINFATTPSEFKTKLSANISLTVGGTLDGTYKILAKTATYIVLDCSYQSVFSLSVQFVYTGYFLKADVFVGLEGHPLASDQPLILSGTKKQIPKPFVDATYKGFAEFDIANLMRKYINSFEYEEDDYFTPSIKNEIFEWSKMDSSFSLGSIKVTEYFDDIDANGNVVTVAGDNITPGDQETIYSTNSANHDRNENAGNMLEYVPNTSGDPISKFLTTSEMWAQFRGKPFAFRAILTSEVLFNSGDVPCTSLYIAQYVNSTFSMIPDSPVTPGMLNYIAFRFNSLCVVPTSISITDYLQTQNFGLNIATYVDDLPLYITDNFPSTKISIFSSTNPITIGQNMATLVVHTNVGDFTYHLTYDGTLVYAHDTANDFEICASQYPSCNLKIETRDINRELIDTRFIEIGEEEAEGVYLITDTDVLNSNYPSDVKFIDYTLVRQNNQGSGSEIQECLYPTEERIISETKTAMLFDEPCRAKTFLWITPVGGWEMFTFTGKNEFGSDIEDKQEFEQDNNHDYPDRFINQKTKLGLVSKTARRTATVNSQPIQFEIYKWAALIQESPQVYMVDGDKLKTVVITNTSYELYKEGDHTFILSFDYKETSTVNSQTR